MASTEKKTKPVLGVLWGLVFGLGLALMAINFKLIDLSIGAAVPVVIVGTILGVVWSLYGPARQPKASTGD